MGNSQIGQDSLWQIGISQQVNCRRREQRPRYQIRMPGGSLLDSYGSPAFYGEQLVESIKNGYVPFSHIDDMVEQLHRPFFEFGGHLMPP